MRLFALLIGGLVGVSTAASASSSVMEDYNGSVRQALVNAGMPKAASSPSEVLPVGGRASVWMSAQMPVLRTSALNLAQAASGDSGAADLAPEPSGERGMKSPVKAFFLSLLVPGLGELYSGHRIRGAVFLAVEGTAWALWGTYRGKGKDWEDKYIAFQAKHWSFARYDAYRHAVWDRAGQESNIWDPSRRLSDRQQDSLTILIGTHHYDDCCGQKMPSDDDRYEMIGKYYRFSYGWDDATLYSDSTVLLSTRFPEPAPSDNGVWGLDKQDWLTVLGGALVTAAYDTNFVYQVQHLDRVRSANRDEYMRMREKSNDNYGTAKKMTTVILFNHVISAIHAARMAKSANRNRGVVEPPKTQLRMTLYRTDRDLMPMLVVWRRF